MPPLPRSRARAARERLERGVDLDDLLDERRFGVEARIGGEQSAVSVSSTQQVGADEVRDERGEPVVVAVADLVVGDGVVLVHDRHDAELEQALHRLAGVEVLRPVAEVVRGEQHLARRRGRARRAVAPSRSISRGWPTAARACSVPMSVRAGRPARPPAGPARSRRSDTSTTWWPAARAAASSPQSLTTRVVVEPAAGRR